MKNSGPEENHYQFPKGFLWGSATAAYQVEGGIDNCDWAVAGEKGKVPRAGRACDHYNLYEEDFDIAQSLSQNAHRFSIEWARIEPEEGVFDEKEIEHYRRVLNALHKRGLKPFVTLWHYTLPVWFAKKGGFQNRRAPKLFARYCEYVVGELGSKADVWMTMNESIVWSSGGYLRGNWPPFMRNLFAYRKVVRRMIAAHNLAYEKIKAIDPKLQVGIAQNCMYFESSGGWWNNFRRNFSRKFWNHTFLSKIKNHQDFVGLNYYHAIFYGVQKDLPKTEMGWWIYPEGLYQVLHELKSYNKPIYITENGIADLKGKTLKQRATELVRITHPDHQERIEKEYFYLLDKMLNMSSYALVIKLCDRLDNLNDMETMTEGFRIKYTEETKYIVNGLFLGRKLTKTHKKILKDIKKHLS